MPIVESLYRPSYCFRNMDVATIYSGKFRRVSNIKQFRERLELTDGDFLDVDWSYAGEKSLRCVILLHGLEGSAQRPYILGAAKMFNQNGFDACAMNFRGCSGEDNRLFSTYHSGKIQDLSFVIQYVIEKGYSEIVIKGFSMGGNISLLYAGSTKQLPTQIKAFVAVSTPCDLAGCSERLLHWRNWLYAENFLIGLKKKAFQKRKKFPNQMEVSALKGIKTLRDFDEIYTSKAHGFKNADHYYAQCSSLFVLEQISIPTLLINAQNDSFLSENCYPYAIAQKSSAVFLETPKYGGHVAFYDNKNIFYTEKRALEFAKNFCK
ncbi:YheT family hydrolase [Capnocytophaga canimorsus]|uniref:YheT family hydrolase n=1 Tax=Capnocytophaga canimorsus TaxID=28188 RepID=UPI001EDDB0DE|nr:alpha/beta fold hydrolase [Capnocytophaga canimorsus]GJQ05476.1 alpha/beta hydrolase [Capnocytophaga canimorsus]